MSGELRVRQMWHLLEPLHAVLYYAPEAFEEAAALGYATEERWASYFAWRAAPLGTPDVPEAVRAFHSFAPAMVDRHISAAWTTAVPQAVLAYCARSTVRIGRCSGAGWRARSSRRPPPWRGAPRRRRPPRRSRSRGRQLRAALAGSPAPRALAGGDRPARAPGRRTHHGPDRGLDPVESLVSFAAIGAAAPEVFCLSRGWSPAEWDAARLRLRERGLLAADGTATEAGRELRAEMELRTDEQAADPWRALGRPGANGSRNCWGSPGWRSSDRDCCRWRTPSASGRCERGRAKEARGRAGEGTRERKARGAEGVRGTCGELPSRARRRKPPRQSWKKPRRGRRS